MDYKTIGLKALGVVAIGGGAVGGVYYYKTLDYEFQEETPIKQFPSIPAPTIRDLLTEKGPLNTQGDQDDATWKSLVTKYLDKSAETNKKIQIVGIIEDNTGKNIDSNVEIFKHTCEALLLKKENNTNNLEMAENWCTKESPMLKDEPSKARS